MTRQSLIKNWVIDKVDELAGKQAVYRENYPHNKRSLLLLTCNDLFQNNTVGKQIKMDLGVHYNSQLKNMEEIQ